MGERKVGIQGPGPLRRDLGRNSAQDPGLHIPNGGMATHLVAKRCDSWALLGSPGPFGAYFPFVIRPRALLALSGANSLFPRAVTVLA